MPRMRPPPPPPPSLLPTPNTPQTPPHSSTLPFRITPHFLRRFSDLFHPFSPHLSSPTASPPPPTHPPLAHTPQLPAHPPRYSPSTTRHAGCLQARCCTVTVTLEGTIALDCNFHTGTELQNQAGCCAGGVVKGAMRGLGWEGGCGWRWRARSSREGMQHLEWLAGNDRRHSLQQGSSRRRTTGSHAPPPQHGMPAALPSCTSLHRCLD